MQRYTTINHRNVCRGWYSCKNEMAKSKGMAFQKWWTCIHLFTISIIIKILTIVGFTSGCSTTILITSTSQRRHLRTSFSSKYSHFFLPPPTPPHSYGFMYGYRSTFILHSPHLRRRFFRSSLSFFSLGLPHLD